MKKDNTSLKLERLKNSIEGELLIDNTTLLLYSTDASVYRETPKVVVVPKTIEDIRKIIVFAKDNNIGIIPRTAGTSLAGQVVGNGIIVDVSKYLNKIIEVNQSEKWVRVEPGVVLDELNMYLKNFGLFFGPETSTSNRCMIGGMLGNNACGAHSLIYGSTRDHTLEVKGFLSDANQIIIKPLSKEELENKCKGSLLENKIFFKIKELLSDKQNQFQIRQGFPEKQLKRRNTGYAIDLLLDCEPFTSDGEPFNLCKILAGSEGTLVFATEIKLNLVPLPPKEKGLICIHFDTLEEAMQGNLIALKYNPSAIELIDDIILNCTKENIQQRKNRFFIQGDPRAIIIVEFVRDNTEEILQIKEALEKEMKTTGLGYHFPLILGADVNKVWALRKAALGSLSNIAGDAKPVSLIEDTAVNVQNLLAYISEFKEILKKHDLKCVFHGHIATGELHLRPIINIKDIDGLKLFRSIATDVAHLVKKYKGSLSGEHGDGRLRGEFIPVILGEYNYNLLKKIKATFDPQNIFNPGKIVNTPAIDEQLRYQPGKTVREINTVFDFSDSLGIIRHTEKCNGSGDCRKSEIIGGIMCPSFMATRDEHDTTRARANILREFLTNSKKKNPFDHKEIYQVLDLCLSCKACKSECPSNVDMTKLKAEFLQHYYDANGMPLRTRLIAYFSTINKFCSYFPVLYNSFAKSKWVSGILKKTIGFADQRELPLLGKQTLKKWIIKNLPALNEKLPANSHKIYFFIDEFINYNDVEIGKKSILLLNHLGYIVKIKPNKESGRTFLSKGLIRKARKIAIENIKIFNNYISNDIPLIGIEPSAILTFRDEYIDLVPNAMKNDAKILASNTFIIDEFIASEFEKGHITQNVFTTTAANIKYHGHCQQKSLASTNTVKKMLSMPTNFIVEEIPSGCCGMAGSFGFEKEHYNLSIKIGELVLFPAIRNFTPEIIIAASGTTCRQQIKDGTRKHALHPVEVIYNALIR
jgi:FAD/FMN-containing dehydrogenase/Fe-S oxidoreductase